VRLLKFLVLVCAATAAHGTVPNDFAYGVRLDTPPGGSIYVVELPMPVYAGLTRPDLGDLRVFNGGGAEVPYALRQPRQVQGEAPAPRSVPIFPLYSEAASAPNLSLRVQTQADGAIIDVQSGRTLHGERPVAWLVDLSTVETRLTALELQWKLPEGAHGFLAHLAVSASDDLTRWHRVVVDATVADVGYGGNRLEQRRIELPSFSGRYLRLEWPAAASEAQLVDARALFAATASHPARQWLPLDGKPGEKAPQQFHYRSGGFFPVDCVRVVPQETNTVVRVTLWSRAGDDAPWQSRGEGLVYDLTLERERLASEPFCFAPVTDPLWRLDVVPAGGGFGTAVPRLELGWNPHRLVFVARGAAPFTLAYGSVATLPGQLGIDPLLQALESQHTGLTRAAVVGEPLVLGGPERRQPPRRETPWRRIALWALLVGGVLLLAAMAWRLNREMHRQCPPE